jgi:ubiquitin-conjugating enzyme E2 S
VAEAGDICVNTLKRDWDPNHGLRHIFEVIRCLLIEPFPESALNEEAGKLLIEDYKGYEQRAKLMTGIYAKPPKAAPAKMPLTTSNTANSGEGAAGAAEKGKEATSAPAKKAGGAQKGKALLRKKSSLKRL